MREQPRGPFSRVRWFCADGTICLPRPMPVSPTAGVYSTVSGTRRPLSCGSRATWSRTCWPVSIRAKRWPRRDFDNIYGQLLIEKFLIAMDDGWIMRGALSYRGAIQEEDERAGARRLLLQMLSREEWIGPHYGAMRAGVKLLPHGQDTASAGLVRQLSAALSDDDPGFMPIRVKIHGAPDASDAAKVREYMSGVTDAGLRSRYGALAEQIDRIYQAAPLPERLGQLAGKGWLPQALQSPVQTAAGDWEQATQLSRMSLSGRLLAELRNNLQAVPDPANRLYLMDFSLGLESEHFRASTAVREQLATMPRGQVLDALGAAGDAAYGTGLLNASACAAVCRMK